MRRRLEFIAKFGIVQDTEQIWASVDGYSIMGYGSNKDDAISDLREKLAAYLEVTYPEKETQEIAIDADVSADAEIPGDISKGIPAESFNPHRLLSPKRTGGRLV